MGYQDAIASIGIATTADNKPSNGTVDGVDSFDTKVYPTVDPATTKEISAPDESAKYAGNVAGWSDSDAYGNTEYAFWIARLLSKEISGMNPFQREDFSRLVTQQQALLHGKKVAVNLYKIA